MFKTTEEIKNNFVKSGWDKTISFRELTLKEAQEENLLFVINGMSKGRKYFRMNVSGNIYNDKGKIVLFNIPCNSNNN